MNNPWPKVFALTAGALSTIAAVIASFLIRRRDGAIEERIWREPALARLPHGFPPEPLWAGAADMAEVLKSLGTRPLKLVAPALYAGEQEWARGPWNPAGRDGKTGKPLLLNQADSFQFSVATADSRQDFHYHSGVFEIYASQSSIEISYVDAAQASKSARVEAGALLVPPGVVHRVKLSGLTYVFQVAVGGGRVADDRQEIAGQGGPR